LASALLLEAAERAGADGLDCLLLFTEPGSRAYHLYLRLGFRVAAEIDLLECTPAREAPPAPPRNLDPTAPSAKRQAIALLNEFHRDHDGWLPMSDALWHWRKVTRPLCTSVRVFLIEDDGATFTLASAVIPWQGRQTIVEFLTDWAWDEAAEGGGIVRAALAAANGRPLLALCSANDLKCRSALREAGFRVSGREVAMLLPLTGVARSAGPPRNFYVPPESVVGV